LHHMQQDVMHQLDFLAKAVIPGQEVWECPGSARHCIQALPDTAQCPSHQKHSAMAQRSQSLHILSGLSRFSHGANSMPEEENNMKQFRATKLSRHSNKHQMLH
jgi:hypothetical protein